MDNVELAKDGGGIRGQDHLLQMVDDNLVAAIGAQRGLDRRRDGPACVDIAQDGAIFGVVAGDKSVRGWWSRGERGGGMVGWLAHGGAELRQGTEQKSIKAAHSLVVALLEQAGVRRVRYVERHDGLLGEVQNSFGGVVVVFLANLLLEAP